MKKLSFVDSDVGRLRGLSWDPENPTFEGRPNYSYSFFEGNKNGKIRVNNVILTNMS